MYSFASGTILSAGTCSPSLPGTQPVSLNISPASFRRAIPSFVMALFMIASICLCAGRERPCRRTAEPYDELPPSHRSPSRFIGSLSRLRRHGNGPRRVDANRGDQDQILAHVNAVDLDHQEIQ